MVNTYSRLVDGYVDFLKKKSDVCLHINSTVVDVNQLYRLIGLFRIALETEGREDR